MNKRLKALKLLPVYCAISAVIIIAGIILYALLGFNYGMEKPVNNTFEVRYNVVAEIEEYEEDIQKTCEDAFAANSLDKYEKVIKKEVGGDYSTETGNKVLVYTFTDASAKNLEAAAASVKAALAGEKFSSAEASVSVHGVEHQRFTENLWRAAVAVGVAAVVALIYIGVRFGVGSALSGLTACVNSVFFTLGLLAVTRMPLFAAGPALYAAIAAFATLLLWLLHAMKMRENFKDPSYNNFTSAEAVATSLKTSEKAVYLTAGALGFIALVFGAVAVSGVRALVLPVLLPVAVSLYSVMLLAPALHVHVKAAFDKYKAKHKRVYVGKKKDKKTETQDAQ